MLHSPKEGLDRSIDEVKDNPSIGMYSFYMQYFVMSPPIDSRRALLMVKMWSLGGSPIQLLQLIHHPYCTSRTILGPFAECSS